MKAIPKIVQKENQVLRDTAKEVPLKEIKSAKVKKIVEDMSIALTTQDDGVAIAAPQIGVSLRIFVVAGKIFRTDEEDQTEYEDLVFINPKITKLSKKKIEMEEGCLSVRWLYGKTKRSDKATVEAYDLDGKKFTWSGSGLMAQIFQHEVDHLNGILFIDHAKQIKEARPEK